MTMKDNRGDRRDETRDERSEMRGTTLHYKQTHNSTGEEEEKSIEKSSRGTITEARKVAEAITPPGDHFTYTLTN